MTTCPKCNSQSISIKYKEDYSGEWLQYTCRVCGFKKNERPKDHLEYKPTTK